jgi:hypothetical protein
LPSVKSPLRFWQRQQPPAIVEATLAAPPPVPALQVVLHIGDGPGRPMPVSIQQRLVLGRVMEGDGEPPDLDLTPFGGQHYGVSRRHVALVHQDRALYVEDLHSTNGTRLNGMPLARGGRYRLRNNDELELGSLRVLVRALPRPR